MTDGKFPVEERLGKIVAGEKWGIVPFTLYKYQAELGLAIHEVWFLCWLFMHKWSYGEAYPSLNAMERYTGISRQYIQEIAHGLEEKKYILITPRFYENGARASNLYDLKPLLSILERTIKEDKRSDFNKKEALANPGTQEV